MGDGMGGPLAWVSVRIIDRLVGLQARRSPKAVRSCKFV